MLIPLKSFTAGHGPGPTGGLHAAPCAETAKKDTLQAARLLSLELRPTTSAQRTGGAQCMAPLQSAYLQKRLRLQTSSIVSELTSYRRACICHKAQSKKLKQAAPKKLLRSTRGHTADLSGSKRCKLTRPPFELPRASQANTTPHSAA